jgi:hypothetical protein
MTHVPARLRSIAPALLLAACAAPATIPSAPTALQPPPGQLPTQVLHARGVQIYECAAVASRPGEYAWAFKAPEADLADAAGRTLGRHYAGPSWEAPDGSLIVGKLRARDAGPDARSIPWLLLDARSTGRDGAFSRVRSIQRVQTVGGLAPAEPCDAAHAAQVARVPYRAVYVFFTPAS